MLEYDVVDVFTDRPFAGNQLAVVHGADGLSDGQLLAITREFGYSETTFPVPRSEAAYDVRIFTPGGEVPFAGHPTLGTAWVLRDRGVLGQASVTQTCGVGPIQVELGENRVALKATPRDLVECPDALVRTALAGLGLALEDRTGTAYVAGTGLNFVHVPVTGRALERARVAGPGGALDVEVLGLRDPVSGVSLVTPVRRAAREIAVEARVFGSGIGVTEDPATGSAATGLGMVLVACGLLPEGGDYVVTQGVAMGRPSTLHGSVRAGQGVASEVTVAGGVCGVASGRIAVPPA